MRFVSHKNNHPKASTHFIFPRQSISLMCEYSAVEKKESSQDVAHARIHYQQFIAVLAQLVGID